jgi:hypothetical protein
MYEFIFGHRYEQGLMSNSFVEKELEIFKSFTIVLCSNTKIKHSQKYPPKKTNNYSPFFRHKKCKKRHKKAKIAEKLQK